MTNSKVRNSDSAYSMCFSQVLSELFTFLINTADKEIYNIFNSFLFLYYFNTNGTNKQTHINRVLIIKIYKLNGIFISRFIPLAHLSVPVLFGLLILPL